MGPLRLIESFANHLARSDRRLVVTITRRHGFPWADNTSGGSIAYRTSKAAVTLVTRRAGIDLASRGIHLHRRQPWMGQDPNMGGPGRAVNPLGNSVPGWENHPKL